jgi:hypothetical protein
MTEQELQQKINEIVEKKLENYFRQHYNGVEIVYGGPTVGHGIAEYSLTTNTSQGIQIYKKGNMKIGANNSVEIRGGESAGTKDTAVLIEAINGNIHIFTKTGDLVLEGKNVQINATGSNGVVSIKSPKFVQLTAPHVKTEASNVSILADNNVKIFGGSVYTHGDIENNISDGVDAVLNGSLISKLLSALDEIKKFFKSPCG